MRSDNVKKGMQLVCLFAKSSVKDERTGFRLQMKPRIPSFPAFGLIESGRKILKIKKAKSTRKGAFGFSKRGDI